MESSLSKLQKCPVEFACSHFYWLKHKFFLVSNFIILLFPFRFHPVCSLITVRWYKVKPTSANYKLETLSQETFKTAFFSMEISDYNQINKICRFAFLSLMQRQKRCCLTDINLLFENAYIVLFFKTGSLISLLDKYFFIHTLSDLLSNLHFDLFSRASFPDQSSLSLSTLGINVLKKKLLAWSKTNFLF